MTSEQQSSALNDPGVDNLFETVIRGYHKRQVEDYIAWLQEQVSAVKAELMDARRELAVAREDLVTTKAQLQTRPQHEEISLRMAQILRLAEEEAQQEGTPPRGRRAACWSRPAARRARAWTPPARPRPRSSQVPGASRTTPSPPLAPRRIGSSTRPAARPRPR